MHRLIRGLLPVALVAGLWLSDVHADADIREFDFGPIISRQRDVHGTMRLRALGPFFERAIHEDGQSLTAVRPLFSHYDNPEYERHRYEVLWPLAHYKGFRDERSGRVLLAWWTRFDINDPESRYRFWLIPLYFQGRDQHGETYMALFPVGGKIHEFLGFDEIRFALFPLYLGTEINTIQSHSVLWPIFSRTEGKGIYRFRVFPFYGQNRHRDRYSKKFIMWPIWTSAEYYIPGSSGSGFILFPFYGQLDLDDQRSHMVLPPFFRISQGDRVNMWLLPWPFFQRRTGEVRQTYVWPIWGQKRMAGNEYRFFVWPILHQQRIDKGDAIAQRLFVLPFYYSETQRERAAAPPPMGPNDPVPRGEMASNYQKLWPFMSYIREGDEARFRMLDLWPLKQTGAIERNYAPFWTLLQNTRLDDASDTEVLWGLFRRQRHHEDHAYTSLFPLVQWERDKVEDRRQWSLLKGLLGYERQGTTSRYRLLYFIRWGQEEDEP